MDVEQKTIENKKVRWQMLQVCASLLAPLLAVLGVWLTIRTNLDTQARAASVQARTQRLKLLAESGDVVCARFSNQFDVFGSPAFPGSSTNPPLSSPNFPNVSPNPSLSPEVESSLFRSDDLKEWCAKWRERPPSLSVQRELIQQLEEHPKQREQILAMWRAIYAPERWIDRIEHALDRGAGRAPS